MPFPVQDWYRHGKMLSFVILKISPSSVALIKLKWLLVITNIFIFIALPALRTKLASEGGRRVDVLQHPTVF
jgi:hypothetical protein